MREVVFPKAQSGQELMASSHDIDALVEKFEGPQRSLTGRLALHRAGGRFLLVGVADCGSPRPLPFMTWGFGDICRSCPLRGLHLAFGLLLCFLVFPFHRSAARTRVPLYDVVLAVIAFLCAAYLWLGYHGIVSTRRDPSEPRCRRVLAVPFEADPRRRRHRAAAGSDAAIGVGWPLVIVCATFIAYSLAGQSMPDLISHKGVSLERLIGYQWLTRRGDLRHPDRRVGELRLSVRAVRRASWTGPAPDGIFLDLAFAMVGKYRGGPAKAADPGLGHDRHGFGLPRSPTR